MNDIRQSSIYFILERHLQIHTFLSNPYSAEVDACLSNPVKERRINQILIALKGLKCIQLDFKRKDATISDVCNMFVKVMAEYSSIKDRLASSARVVHNPTLEDAIVTMQCEKQDRLQVKKRVAVKRLQVHGGKTSLGTNRRRYLIERARKRRKMRGTPSFKLCVGTTFIVSTSNICECLFSLA